MNQKTFFGHNAVHNLQDVLQTILPRSILLVTGKKSFQISGAQSIFEDILADVTVHAYSDFEMNPRIEDVERGILLFKQYHCDLVVAVGGGSVMDMAKLINCFQANSNYRDIALNNAETKNNGVPLIAIPTTAGSGSESTRFAVLYIDGKKFSVDHESILPDIAIIDPQFTYSLSPHSTAVTGLDAFCQSIESFWSVNSTEESSTFAENAIKIIWDNLSTAVHSPTVESRTMMSQGALMAGKAINITRTTAPHALSYFLTSRYHIPHGHAVALFLPYFFEYNLNVTYSDCNDVRGYEFVQERVKSICRLIDAHSYNNIRKTIQSYIASLGVEADFTKLNILYNDMMVILDQVNQQRLKNNPRLYRKDELLKIIFS